MQRYFSIVETARMDYECRPTNKQEKEIEKIGFQKWLEVTSLDEIFENSSLEEISGYLESDQTTVLEE